VIYLTWHLAAEHVAVDGCEQIPLEAELVRVTSMKKVVSNPNNDQVSSKVSCVTPGAYKLEAPLYQGLRDPLESRESSDSKCTLSPSLSPIKRGKLGDSL